MTPATKQEGNNFQYWLGMGLKAVMAVLLMFFTFFGSRMVQQNDETQKAITQQYDQAQKEINALNIKVATLETKLDFIIKHMDYNQNTASK